MEVSIDLTSTWDNGGTGKIKVMNTTDTTLYNWSFQMKILNVSTIDFWNVSSTKNGDTYTISGLSWNPSLLSNRFVESNFNFTGNASVLRYEVIQVNEPVSIVNTSTAVDVNNEVVDIGGNENGVTGGDSKLKKKVFAYFTEWAIYSRAYNVSDIPANKITHLLYAFMLPNPSQADLNILKENYPFPPLPYDSTIPEGTLVHHDGNAASKNIPALQSLKVQNPHLKVLVSIGGWTLSWTMSKVCADDVLRQRLVKSSVDFIVKNGFDGIDIDWEYVGVQGAGYNYIDEVNDPINFVKFLKDLRVEMDSRSPNKYLEITAATGANPKVLENYRNAIPHLDYVLLMTYDYAGAWQKEGGHQSGLYKNPVDVNMPEGFYVDYAVNKVRELGCPNNKICIGTPFYGRGWSKLEGGDPVIFGSVPNGQTIAANTYSGASGQPGVSSWKDLRNKINDGTLKEYIDDVAKAAYAVNPTTNETWTYDSVQTATDKANYVIDEELAGMLAWELSDDTRDGSDSLLDALYNKFTSEDIPEPTPEPQPEPTPEPQPEPEPTPEPQPEPTPEPEPEEGCKCGENCDCGSEVVIHNTSDQDIVIKAGETKTLKKIRIRIDI
jgi:GH18 family chitinase